MSTKTTIKRVALVAVAALGMGVLSTVPASAARSLSGISNVNSITVSTNRTPVAGDNGNSAVHTITFVSDSLTGNPIITPIIKLTSKPALSAMDSARTTYDGTLASTEWEVSSTALTQTVANALAYTVSAGTQVASAADLTLSTANAAGNLTGKLYMHANYDVAGTYVWTVFDDANSTSDGIFNGSDFGSTFTVVVASPSNSVAATATTTVKNATSAVDGTYGSLVTVNLKDAAGNPVAPDSTAGVKVTLTGGDITLVNGAAVSATTTYTLGAGDFNGSGSAFLNITNSAAETIYLSLSNAGFSSFTAPATVAITFKTITATATSTLVTGLLDATNPKRSSAAQYYYDGKAQTLSFKTNTAAATYDKITVTDSSGAATGYAGGIYDLAVLGATTGDDKGSFSIAVGTTTTDISFSVNGGSAVAISDQAAATDSIEIDTESSIRAAAGAKLSFTATVYDQFGNALANKTVTPTISGRNSALVLSNLVSDASGEVTFTYTDASTSTTSLTDTITLTQGSYSDTASVSFTSAANLGAATVLVTTPHTTSLGVTEAVATYTDIAAGAAGPTGTTAALSATVKDASGITLAGVPVVWTISGTTAAIPTNKVTSYTSNVGVATSTAYGWAAGTYTVTATVGTVSDTAPVNFAQLTDTEARTITAAASGNIVTATVKDRFGNGVYNVAVYATRTGAGNFAGSSKANSTTDRNGQVEFIVSGGAADVTVSVGTSVDFGQTDALAGLVSTTTATDIFTASAAGTSTTAEKGVGASLSAAGNNSAKVTVDAADAANTAADAAAEATDAANAATDAANAAAEAADAATAAAQDAADAVAALSAQVASLISGLKAQLTALTNLVIKIQKKVKA